MVFSSEKAAPSNFLRNEVCHAPVVTHTWTNDSQANADVSHGLYYKLTGSHKAPGPLQHNQRFTSSILTSVDWVVLNNTHYIGSVTCDFLCLNITLGHTVHILSIYYTTYISIYTQSQCWLEFLQEEAIACICQPVLQNSLYISL